MKKHTLQHVKDCFIKNNCIFLDNEYKNVNHPHNYICSCGNKSKICFNNFKNGNRCVQCRYTPKHNLEYIKDYFAKNNCVFLDDEYKNSGFPHNYICSCENKSKISLDAFKAGNRCMKCSGFPRHTLEYIKNYFAKNNCIFLDNEYVNSKHPHNYICSCKNKSKISFNNFQNGKRCRSCTASGFNSSKSSFVYLVGNHYKQKIGIMNINTKRLENHMRNFGMELIDKIYFSDGNEAMGLESKILNTLKQKNIPHGKQVFKENFNGITESWLIKDLEVKSINELINL